MVMTGHTYVCQTDTCPLFKQPLRYLLQWLSPAANSEQWTKILTSNGMKARVAVLFEGCINLLYPLFNAIDATHDRRKGGLASCWYCFTFDRLIKILVSADCSNLLWNLTKFFQVSCIPATHLFTTSHTTTVTILITQHEARAEH
jgi:hypothetical protein